MNGGLADKTIRDMVHLVDPDAEVRDVVPAESGFSPVYRVVVDTATGNHEWFLKATPEEGDTGVSADARILTILRERTAIPVPEVLGVVDDHGDLPSPFYLMDSMPGNDVSYEQVGWMSNRALRTTARQIGAHLGELHGIDAVDSFGHVSYDTAQQLAGGRPSGTEDELTVADGYDTWQGYLREWVERELTRHADSRFDQLTPELESWCYDRLGELTGPSSPVLGRNDHGFHNLLIDPDTGEVTTMLDWAYTLAVPPAFDFEYGAYLFSGAFLSGIPEVPDRRELVRNAMLAGYESTAPDRSDAVSTHYPLYEMLAMMRVMNDFDQLEPRLPDGTVDAVAIGIREDAGSILEESR